MTDITAASPRVPAPAPFRRVDFTSKEAQQRLRKRYRSESIYRTTGMLAIALTGLFLAVMIGNIAIKGIPAFWEHYVVADVPLSPAVLDPKGDKSPESIRAGDYLTLSREAITSLVPGIEGRAAKRELTGLLSNGAADDLRNRLAADPSLLGQTVTSRFLLSDTADLYFKGVGTPIRTNYETRAIATPSGTTGQIKILLSANDFADDLQTIKDELKNRAAALTAEASRLERIGSEGALASAARMRETIKGLTARVDQVSGAEVLDQTIDSRLVAINGGLVRLTEMSATAATGEVLLPLSSSADAQPGQWGVVTYETPEADRKVSDRQVAFLEKLRADGKIESGFNFRFFTAGDSREAELAGLGGALVGSLLTLAVTLAVCLPIGVMAAIYLEEFAPKNWVTDLIEININNLAAVPSIVFGLLGLAVFLNFFGLPRSAPLVGGLVLALLVLPMIIIAARASMKAVPPSIKEAALGVGASHQQAVFHHMLPLAIPGIMTGTILGVANALGQTAPLLMIGMVAFVVDVPGSITEAATGLPVQLYLWSDLPEPAFEAKTAAGILVLLAFLFALNGTAIWLRSKFERRW